RQDYPIVMHGVSMSLGSAEPLDIDYLKKLKELINRVEPVWVSEHLCWTKKTGHDFHELLPLPYDKVTAQFVADKVQQAQDFLGRRLLLENVSSYLTYSHSAMTEWEFYSEVVEKADCLMLFDINNVYVNAFNHNFNPLDYLKNVPKERVWQFHLAGHSTEGDKVLIDTHDYPVCEEVWDLYKESVRLFGAVSTMIERDGNYPPLSELIEEINSCKKIMHQVLQANEEPVNRESESTAV
ncbi:MAG: DUF692 domain-containing protein, partial [Candidatus Dadabacteria bacterium]